MKDVVPSQNDATSLDLLAASLAARRQWGRLAVVRVVALGLIALASLLGSHWAQVAGWGAVAGGLATVISEITWPKLSAKLRCESMLLVEQFEVRVFGLPWNAALGEPVPDVRLAELALKNQSRDSLRDWYPGLPKSPGALPVVESQIYSLSWGTRSRILYQRLIVGVCLAVLAGGAAWALLTEQTLSRFLLGFILPASPLLVGLLGDVKRVREAASLRVALTARACAIRDRLKDTSTPGSWPRAARSEIRSLQDEILRLRLASVPTPSWLHWVTRRQNARVLKLAAERARTARRHGHT